MEKEFVTYEQALALKELGFNEKCMGYFDVRLEHQIGNFDFTEIKGYDESIAALSPLKQQVFRWFREKHECYANLSSWIHEEEIGIYHEFEIYKVKQYSHGSIRFKTYEEAENACIDKLIELTKTK